MHRLSEKMFIITQQKQLQCRYALDCGAKMWLYKYILHNSGYYKKTNEKNNNTKMDCKRIRKTQQACYDF